MPKRYNSTTSPHLKTVVYQRKKKLVWNQCKPRVTLLHWARLRISFADFSTSFGTRDRNWKFTGVPANVSRKYTFFDSLEKWFTFFPCTFGEEMGALAFKFPVLQCGSREELGFRASGGVGGGGGFPSFLPKEIHNIKDPSARTLARRIQRVPVQIGFSENCIMSSCVTPATHSDSNPVVLLHCFDSSCLEWRAAYLMLERAGLEAWAVDILGWGFSDLETRPPCDVASKRKHLYQLWKSHIGRPMILVGPSLGASVAIDFAVNFPEAVDRLVLINASVYAKGTGYMMKLPKTMAYAMVSLLKSIPVRFYAKRLVFNGLPLSKTIDWMNVGRLHCLLPWWEDATVDFMLSGGYNVSGQIKQVKQKTLIICSEDDKIISSKLSKRLQSELPNAVIQQVPGCGHMPHVEKPDAIATLIIDFARSEQSYNGKPLSYLVRDVSPNNLPVNRTF